MKKIIIYFYNKIKFFYQSKKFGKLGENTKIGKFVEISYPKNIHIGNKVKIHQGVILRPSKKHLIKIGDESGINPYVSIFGKVEIGRWAMIAPNVVIAGGNHVINELDKPMIKSGKSINKGIIIKDDVWVGANSVITDGVTIGEGAVIAAGSVVTKNVLPYDVVAGCPAKKISNRKLKNKNDEK